MRHRPTTAITLALSAVVLGGCAGAEDLDRDREGISMVPYRERVADDRAGSDAGLGAGLDMGSDDRSGAGAGTGEGAGAAEGAGAGAGAGAAAEDHPLEDCGDPDDAENLEMSAGGADLELVVPADAGEDAVEELEEYREESGADPVCWVLVRVDNSSGDEVVDLPLVEVLAADGGRVELQRAAEALAAWSDLRPDDEDAAVRAVELVAEQDGVVGPGEEGEVVLLAPADLDGPRGVRVQPSEGAALVRVRS